ncbi:MAG: sel1 repeat family protein [Eggerthellaceae bacterium]|nr:sel1 repeat family protein [Eggerthellaceae bacterium]
MTRQFAAVGVGARTANLIFGSPSVMRANGFREVSSVPAAFRGRLWSKRRAGTPVFAVDHPVSGEASLPRIWVTEPAYDQRSGRIEGREFTCCYPNGADADGRKALRLAQAYFAEGLTYSSACDSEVRRDCFRAAEILYLHAASRGSVEASVKLGAIYDANLCEGLYWAWEVPAAQECRMGSLPLHALAFERYSFAAVRGNAEACWLLGDMVLVGRGCVSSPQKALALYQRSYEIAIKLGDRESEGNAALRLGRMAESGLLECCNLKQALAWYRLSLEALDHVLAGGAWHYKRAWHEAKTAVARMRQELCGSY